MIMQKNIQVARLWNKDLKKKMHNPEVLRTRKYRLLSAAYKLRGQWSKVFKNIFKKDYQKVNVDVENWREASKLKNKKKKIKISMGHNDLKEFSAQGAHRTFCTADPNK